MLLGSVKISENELPGAENILLLKSKMAAVETISKTLSEMKFSHFIGFHDSFGKNCLPRVAAKLSNGFFLSDVMGIESKLKTENGNDNKDEFIFTKSIYAGNAIAKIQSQSGVSHCLTIRANSFEPIETTISTSSKTKLVEEVSLSIAEKGSRFIRSEVTESKRPDLGSAKIIVSGGRALKSAENFEKYIYPLADVLGAAVGASRAAVDAGYVGNDLQIGQTGKIVGPQLYFAIGISGAIQHVAGIKDSKIIVAINKDGECPIFQVADYGLVGDLFTILPELTEKLKNLKV